MVPDRDAGRRRLGELAGGPRLDQAGDGRNGGFRADRLAGPVELGAENEAVRAHDSAEQCRSSLHLGAPSTERLNRRRVDSNPYGIAMRSMGA